MGDDYFSKASQWFDASNLSEMYKILKIGDILQMTGSGFPTQWAICSKVKQSSAVVIYRDTLTRMKDEQSTRAIQKHGLAALLGKRQVCINNVNDNHYAVEPSRYHIAYKAEYFLHFPHRVTEVPNFVCHDEHRRLVTLCRYDLNCLREVEAINGHKNHLSSLNQPTSAKIPDTETGDSSSKCCGTHSSKEMETYGRRKSNFSSRVKSTSDISETPTRVPNGKSVEEKRLFAEPKNNSSSPMTVLRNRIKKSNQKCHVPNTVITQLLNSKESEHYKLKTFVLDFASYSRVDNCNPSSRFYVSRWLNGPELRRTLFARLNVGDLLEISRVGYCHWSVCVRVFDDDAIVAHRINDSKLNSSESRIGITSLMTLAEGRRVRVNNSRDIKFHVLSTAGVMYNVNFYVKFPDKVGDHDFITNNCEHFATVCRYGVKCSIFGKVIESPASVTERLAMFKSRKAVAAAIAGKRLTEEMALAVVEERGMAAAAEGGSKGKIKEAAVNVVQDLFKAAVDDFLESCTTNKSNKKKVCDRVPRLS